MYIKLSDAALFAEVKGEGEPVILLHAHSVDSRMWDPQFGLLAESHHAIRYDMRGYGRSSEPDPGRHFRHADDLVSLMDRLGVKKAHLIGLSLGAMVALDCLAEYPDRVLSAVCAGSGLYVREDEIWPAYREMLQEHEYEARPIELAAFKEEWIEGLLGCSGPRKDGIEKPLRTMIGEWSAWQPKYERKRPLVGPSLIPLLRERQKGPPLLVVVGGYDSEGSKHAARKLLELMPEAERADLAEGGHFSNMDAPEAFNKAVFSFIHRSAATGHGN